MLQQGDKLIGCAGGIDGEVIRLPMGVFGLIAPFNFPAMVPFWFIPYAIATGNTFVCKPSEQVPMTMRLITEYMDQTDLPAGIFNLVNGDKEVSVALAEHPEIQGISLVGRSTTCKIVAENAARHRKRFQGLGSAKKFGGHARCPGRPSHTQYDDLLLWLCGPAMHGFVCYRCGR